MNKEENGFTLIEILVVVAILGVLMGLVSFLVVRARKHGEIFATEQVVKAHLPAAIDRFYRELDRQYPAHEQWFHLSVIFRVTPWSTLGKRHLMGCSPLRETRVFSCIWARVKRATMRHVCTGLYLTRTLMRSS